jgi:hypothetical protein
VYEPILSDTAPGAVSVPSVIEAAGIAERAGLTEVRSVTVVYAPTSVTHHHNAPAPAPAPALAAAVALPVPSQPAPAAAAAARRRRFTRAELGFHVGMAITGSGIAAVVLSMAAGDPSLLLAAPPVVGCATILGSAMAINREESRR